MKRRELGATVSVMWVIFLIVLLLGAGAYIYFVQSDIQKAKNDATAALREKNALQESLVAEKQLHVDLSQLVGFVDESAGDVYSSKAALEAKIEQLRGRFPNDIGSEDKTLESLSDRLVAVAEKFDSLAQTSETNFQGELKKRQESETAKDQIKTSMDDQLNSLNSDLRDERDRAQSQKTTDDAQIAQLQDTGDELSAQLREQVANHEQQVSSMAQEKRQSDARVAELSSKVRLIGIDEDPWAEDGEVIAVGQSTGLVFVNIGANDLLRTGIKFDVFRYGKGGNMLRKGSIEIREVNADSAVGGVVEELSSLDPITAGDVIANPHFSGDRSKVFALLGNFPVYGKSFLENRLKALGAEVETDVNSRVDFVVLGQKSNEEDAPELSEMPGYKLATELGIQMLPMRSIDRFLKP